MKTTRPITLAERARLEAVAVEQRRAVDTIRAYAAAGYAVCGMSFVRLARTQRLLTTGRVPA